MTEQLELKRYPYFPGSKGVETSARAASQIASLASGYRGQCLRALTAIGDATADEIATALGISVLTIRPRIAELNRMGAITDTGERRLNISGRRAAVWRLRAN